MIKLKSPLTALILCVTFPSLAGAQVCNDLTSPEVVSVENFSLFEDTATDNVHSLNWNRCLHGMTWDTATQSCVGLPEKLTWQEALQMAQTKGWRLPNVKELYTVIDTQCFVPPLNPTLFPQAPGSLGNGMWTSTPVLNTVTTGETRAWLVELGHGILFQRNILNKEYVIFVR